MIHSLIQQEKYGYTYDIWTLNKVDDLLSEVLVFNPELVSFCFVNKADSRGSYKDDAADILGEAKNLHYLDNPIGNRIAFANAAAEGLGVLETQPLDDKAVNELNSLFTSINTYLSGS